MLRNGPKRTISASSEFWLLQMVLEPDTRQCAAKDAGLPREMDCEIPNQMKRNMNHKVDCDT